MKNELTKYSFSELATNNTVRASPQPGDEKTYIGLEHINSDVLAINEWGSDTVLIGDKFKMTKGDILFARRNAYLRRVGIAPFDGIFSAHGMIFHPITTLMDPEFFPFFIKSNEFMNRAVKISVGSMSPTVNWKDLKKEVFGIPSIEEQRKHATLLWSLEKLIEQYKKRLVQYDQLIKSRFNELIHSEETENVTVESICTDIVDCPHSTPIHSDEKTPYPSIRTSELVNGSIDWTSMKYVSKEEYEKRIVRIVPQPLDVVYGREGSYGDAVILPEGYSFCLGQRVMLLRANSEICDPYYLHSAIRSDYVYKQAEACNKGATVGHVNVKDIKKFKLPLPPKDKQSEYVEFIKQVDKSRLILQSQIQQTLELQMTILDSILMGDEDVE